MHICSNSALVDSGRPKQTRFCNLDSYSEGTLYIKPDSPIFMNPWECHLDYPCHLRSTAVPVFIIVEENPPSNQHCHLS